MKQKIYTYFVIGLIAIGISGCEKLIEITPPLNETPSAAVFTTDKTALAALSGMYSQFSQLTVQTTGLPVYTALMADDLRYLLQVVVTAEYNANTYTAISASTDPFSGYYTVIYRANAIIEGLTNYSGTSDRVKKELIAEAQFMRAYCYFNLVNLYGDVPLVVQTDVNVTAFLPRETAANVYAKIIADLTDAKANLLPDFSFTTNERVGVNKFTAAAMLARVYLFTGNYALAESNASEVIAANTLFTMVPSATMGTALFVKNSTESIWQLLPSVSNTNQFTTEAGSFIPSSNTTTALNYELRPAFVQLFGATDRRRTLWMRDLTINSTVYTIPFKFKYRDQAQAVAANVSEYQVILRLAEQYLIRAEARARIGTNLTGARDDLNIVHERAGLVASTTLTPSTLLDEIALENRKEFFCEQGFRWFNLKRTNLADAVLGPLKPTWRPEAKLYPIAQSIINANPYLIQSPGY